MPRAASLVALASLVLLAACREPTSSPAPGQTATASAPVAAPDLELVEFTTAGADASQPLPLIVVMHGLGDRPENVPPWLRDLPAPARVYALRAPKPHGNGFSWFDVTSRPGGPVDAALIGPGVRDAAERVLANLDRLVARKPTRGKPVVTGFSQGGMISFALAALAPERLTGAFPIGGVLPSSIEPPAPPAAAPLLRAFHGGSDARVPIDLARASIERFRSRGWSAELRDYPGVGHTIAPDERRDLLRALADAVTQTR